MFRSIWFWVILLLVGAAFWLGRDQIASYFEKIPMEAPKRTTNTQELASKTPPKTPSAVAHATTVTPVKSVIAASSVGVAAAPSTPRPASPPQTQYVTYIVKKGDNLYRISQRYHTDVKTLQRINHISDPSTLYVGQELKVPAPPPKPTKPAPKPGTTRYTVQKGDSLSSIARKFHTSVGTLQKLNHFSDPNNLVVGSVILVPAQGSATTSGTHPTPGPGATAKPSTGTSTSAPASSTAAPPATPSPTPTATPTPIPTVPSVCGATDEVVYVWGVSFCVPPGWKLEQEYATPHRTAWITKDEESGDRSLYAISRLEGSPNAPLSWSMRQAKKSISKEIASLIPGGLSEPQNWSAAVAVSIDGSKGQMSEADAAYLATGHPAHIRVIVFNHADQRWRIVIVAPQEQWQNYDVTVFPYIARTMEVF